MSICQREEVVKVVKFISQRKCDYCGLVVDADKLPVGWVSLSCQCEYMYFIESEMCPKCTEIKGIIASKDHYE